MTEHCKSTIMEKIKIIWNDKNKWEKEGVFIYIIGSLCGTADIDNTGNKLHPDKNKIKKTKLNKWTNNKQIKSIHKDINK